MCFFIDELLEMDDLVLELFYVDALVIEFLLDVGEDAGLEDVFVVVDHEGYLLGFVFLEGGLLGEFRDAFCVGEDFLLEGL